jgi:hypothetical protein
MSIRAMKAILSGILLTGVVGAAHAVHVVSAVPEPGTCGMLASGVVAAGAFLYSRTRKNRK